MDDYYYMEEAYKYAEKAYKLNEVPIGCVIVKDENIIGSGYNLRNTKKNALYHAEIIAIDEACNFINDWRLEDAHLFVTVEPCPMCAGAILQSRIKRLVFGTRNAKAGSCYSILNILDNSSLNHRVEVVEGVMQEESSNLMKKFFSELRHK